ncbi:hypothetical protein BG011_001832, partial [Mortierella polycephala]
TADLTRMVEALAQTNVRFLTLDLKNSINPRLDVKLLGKGRYRPLLDLFASRKLQHVTFKRSRYLGTRTSSLPRGFS